MAKKVTMEEQTIDFNSIDTTENTLVEIPLPKKTIVQEEVVKVTNSTSELVNCLRNEKVIVKKIPKQTGLVKDPKHVLFGGMSENAKRTFTVPLLRSGSFVDVLTKDEKNYLEYIMGLEPNALSVHRKVDNFWSTANPKGISTVTLHKQDNFLDLSDPEDYIRYKILLANKDYIAPSLDVLQSYPKATYDFVIVTPETESKVAVSKMNTRKEAYKELGKVEDNRDILKLVIETIDGRPVATNTKLEVMQAKVDDLIQANTGLFLKVVKDPLLNTKVLINRAIENGIIAKRGNYLYMRDTNTPLCDNGQEPVFNIAATYLNHPKRQDLKFSIEAKLNNQ